MNILIILNSLNQVHDLENSLNSVSHSVTHVTDSTEAINYLKKHQVDLIITEIEIGKVDGWRLSRLVRSGVFPSHAELPIVVVVDDYCERLAEATARLFDINYVTSYAELGQITDTIEAVRRGEGQLNKLQKVLVIEDTQDTAELVKRMLRQNFEVEIAVDGEAGIARFHQEEYDIVLLDIMMPGMTGEQVIEVLLEINPNQVVIIMTAHGTVDLAEMMLEKGATDFIQKPFKAEQLRKVCDIASKREDFVVSNAQFAARSVELHDQQEKYQSLSKTHYRILDSLNTVVLELDTEGRLSFLNAAWQQCMSYPVSQSIGQYLLSYVAVSEANMRRNLELDIQMLISENRRSLCTEVKMTRRNNQSIWCELNLSPYFNQDGILVGLAGTLDDISERKKVEQNLQYVAVHDALTGLHNRYYFEKELENTAKVAQESDKTFQLLYLDLDHFKVINDSQGHHQGDLVLQEIARILSSKLRKEDILCRIGGDEFVYMLSSMNQAQATVFAQEICNAIAQSRFQYGDNVYKVSCSIGLSEINGLLHSADLYLQRADIAMFAAKNKGRNCVHTYRDEDKLTDQLKQGFEWAHKLQLALLEDNIEIHFQPIIDVKTREIEYYEALVRLIVEGKLVYPGEFIPSLEKAEDMNLLDRHVIGKTFSIMHKYPAVRKVAINLSAQAFANESLLSYIEEKLNEYQLNPSRVIFELTETDSLTNITATQRTVASLNQLGCAFSIDDFGTGFSTFSYLKQIPATSVKIDGSFVKDMLNDPIDAALVKAIHETAKALSKKTVAEFVEDEATLLELEQVGVHYAQGYHISKPKPVEQLGIVAESKLSASCESVDTSM
ncbi:diguanylate cyclase [Saccharobesus litoralis]|uniref:Diguanylate cyclase n=1 Tax=Saccharobesus litoralis TaxID=2172099 RepID=A0A2S0VTB5_9ALTE|nr:EAL domain-containing protein [Saccharobesus litoralis]AWB67422.1 diguanylate cyclase [Saccharobesus litoralis]